MLTDSDLEISPGVTVSVSCLLSALFSRRHQVSCYLVSSQITTTQCYYYDDLNEFINLHRVRNVNLRHWNCEAELLEF